MPTPPPLPLVRAVNAAMRWLGRARRAITPPPLTVLEMTSMAYFTSSGVLAAISLGIPGALKDGPRSPAQIASAIGADADAVFRLLRALSSVGLFDESNGCYSLNRLSMQLLPGTPGSMAPIMRFAAEGWHHRAWGALAEAVRTGKSGSTIALGKPLFEYLEDDAEATAIFHEGMSSFSSQTAEAVVAVYDLSTAVKLVDVGAGHGQFLAVALARHPRLRGVAFDRPHAVEGATATFAVAGCADRVEIVSGSFFDAPLPAGGDIYTLMNILHDWSDADAERILRRCREALPPLGKLLIVEMVLPADNRQNYGSLFDLEMMVLLDGGRERTEADFRRLCAAAGLRVERVLPTASLSCVIEVGRS